MNIKSNIKQEFNKNLKAMFLKYYYNFVNLSILLNINFTKTQNAYKKQ